MNQNKKPSSHSHYPPPSPLFQPPSTRSTHLHTRNLLPIPRHIAPTRRAPRQTIQHLPAILPRARTVQIQRLVRGERAAQRVAAVGAPVAPGVLGGTHFAELVRV